MSKKGTRIILIAAAIISLAVIVWCGVYLWQYWQGGRLDELLQRNVEENELAGDIDAETAEIPVDFEALKEVNEDIYAWLYVPGMDISYPVVQHPTDNSYYIRRSSDGSSYSGGCIYSENYNSRDFSDRMTVLYGHNLRSGKMFAPLNDFADVRVFDSHRYIYVYLPDRELVYEIIAACPYSYEHILTNRDFNSRADYEEFFGQVMHRTDLNANYLEGVELSYDSDRVLTLSTCLRGNNQQRYIVMGRLIAEIPAA